MEFREKLKRLSEGESRARIAREAGLTPSMLNSYVNRGSEPLAGAAMKLARALKVPLDWLVDDTRDWPPPNLEQQGTDIRDVPNGKLLIELARRYRLTLLEALQTLDEAEKIDWSAVSQELRRLADGRPPSDSLIAKMSKLSWLLAARLTGSTLFDPQKAANILHDQLPGRERKLETTTFEHFVSQYDRLFERPGVLESFLGLGLPHFSRQIDAPPLAHESGDLVELMKERMRIAMSKFVTGQDDASGGQKQAKQPKITNPTPLPKHKPRE